MYAYIILYLTAVIYFVYRGTFGGCFSTTLGSVCHELGHTFDLGHSKYGIMGRGFDNIHLVFITPSEDTVSYNI